MKYIIIYVIISYKGLQIKINIFSMLSPDDIYIYIYYATPTDIPIPDTSLTDYYHTADTISDT